MKKNMLDREFLLLNDLMKPNAISFLKIKAVIS